MIPSGIEALAGGSSEAKGGKQRIHVERVENRHGSCAGASSSEFDQYRNERNRERARMAAIEEEARREEERKALEEKVLRNRLEAEERTKKNAEKRKKKKEKKKLKKSLHEGGNDDNNSTNHNNSSTCNRHLGTDEDEEEKDSGDEKVIEPGKEKDKEVAIMSSVSSKVAVLVEDGNDSHEFIHKRQKIDDLKEIVVT